MTEFSYVATYLTGGDNIITNDVESIKLVELVECYGLLYKT